MYLPSNPAVPVNVLANKYEVPSPDGLQVQMLKTFNEMMKVTKKTVQRNYLEKLQKSNLLTQHGNNIRRLILRNNKSVDKEDERKRIYIGRLLMDVIICDANDDLENHRFHSGIMLRDMLQYFKRSNPDDYDAFKEEFSVILRHYRKE